MVEMASELHVSVQIGPRNSNSNCNSNSNSQCHCYCYSYSAALCGPERGAVKFFIFCKFSIQGAATRRTLVPRRSFIIRSRGGCPHTPAYFAASHVGREKVNCPAGAREAVLGHDLGAPVLGRVSSSAAGTNLCVRPGYAGIWSSGRTHRCAPTGIPPAGAGTPKRIGRTRERENTRVEF